MTIATGVAKTLAIKKETTWGTAAGASGAQLLRRVTSDLSLSKDTYQSAEIRTDYQIADFRHGMRSVNGSIDGELSPGTYQLPLAAALRKLFGAVSNITTLTLTVAASGSNYTITRSAGDWLAGNIKVGTVIRVTAGLNANSLNKNLLVLAATTTVLTVAVLNGTSLTVEATVAGCTVTVPGMRSWVPLTGHTNESFTIEHWFSDIAQSELFTGCRVSQIEVNLPPTGMATIKITFLGKDVTTATTQYFTTPTALSSSGVVAAVNGALVAQGAAVGLVTGLSFTINGNMSVDPVVGSNTPPDVFAGSVVVNGQASVYFQDAVFRDYFLNEAEVALAAAFTTGSSGTADFMSFAFPRVKFGGASKGDGQKGIVQTMPFTALLAANGGATFDHEQTTLMICDSLAA